MSVAHLGILNNGAVINPLQVITPKVTDLSTIITGPSNELKVYDTNGDLLADFKNGGGSEQFAVIITPDNSLTIEEKNGTPMCVINTTGLDVAGGKINGINNIETDSSNELKIYASDGVTVLADFKIGGETLNTSEIVTGPSNTLTIYESDGKTQLAEIDDTGIFIPAVNGVSLLKLSSDNNLKIASNAGGTLAELDGTKFIVDYFQIPTGATNGYVLSSDADGNASWSAPTISGISEIKGTTNEINVSTVGSVVTLSTPQDIATSSNVTFNKVTAGSVDAPIVDTDAINSDDLKINSADGKTNFVEVKSNVLIANNINSGNYYGKSGTGHMQISATDGTTQLVTFVDGGTSNFYGKVKAIAPTFAEIDLVQQSQTQTAGWTTRVASGGYSSLESIVKPIGLFTYNSDGTNQKLVFVADKNGNCTALLSLTAPAINASATMTTPDLVVSGKTATNTFQLLTTPTNKYVLTSDASGNGSWQPVDAEIIPSTISIGQINSIANNLNIKSADGKTNYANFNAAGNTIYNGITLSQLYTGSPTPSPIYYYAEGITSVSYGNAGITDGNNNGDGFRWRQTNKTIDCQVSLWPINPGGGVTIGPPGSANPYLLVNVPADIDGYTYLDDALSTPFIWYSWLSALNSTGKMGRVAYIATGSPPQIGIDVNTIWADVQFAPGNYSTSGFFTFQLRIA
jgi:hypothetical protein